MRSGAVIGASRDVSDAARFIGRDAADALVRDRNWVNARPARLRIVNHRIAAGIIGPFFILGWVALLGAEIDFAASADVVAGVNFRLGRETLSIRADRFLSIDDSAHLAGFRIEFDEPGIETVGVG